MDLGTGLFLKAAQLVKKYLASTVLEGSFSVHRDQPLDTLS
jgi:hypothetical protein